CERRSARSARCRWRARLPRPLAPRRRARNRWRMRAPTRRTKPRADESREIQRIHRRCPGGAAVETGPPTARRAWPSPNRMPAGRELDLHTMDANAGELTQLRDLDQPPPAQDADPVAYVLDLGQNM